MLTKSNFMKYIECPMYFWLSKHRPELIPENTPELERIFATGREVDDLARNLFLNGVEVGGYNREGWANTKQAMAKTPAVLFQPTAVTDDNLSCRADILTYDRKNKAWDIHEVKMGTKVKPENIIDVAFQRNCFEKAGVKIGKTFLVHINNKYIRNGAIEPEKLFISEDITEVVIQKTQEVREAITDALNVLEVNVAPDIHLIGKCSNPKRCEYLKYYIDGYPEVYDKLGELPEKLLRALLLRKVLKLEMVPKRLIDSIGFIPEAPFERIDAPAIKQELRKLEYPLYFFDYETYGSAIPPFDGYRPYQQIPFQYSLFMQKNESADLEHFEFLARSFADPVPALLEKMKKDIGPKGSVIVWFASFESGRNREMAELYPRYADMLNAINGRIFDLMLLFKFKNQLYVHSEFEKSASLKKVLPVLCPELAYDDLAIQEGREASASWPIMTSAATTEDERARLAKDMLVYCKRDTEAMVGILEKVKKEVGMK